jgi:hypothetical protein
MTMTRTIDLNCDMGEIAALVEDGTQERLMEHVTSVNVACGGHAGDDGTMTATIAAARRRGLAVGAHPGYPDPAHFGRRALALSPDAVAASVEEQVARLREIAARFGVRLGHVKPHGALYNQAADDPALAICWRRSRPGGSGRGVGCRPRRPRGFALSRGLEAGGVRGGARGVRRPALRSRRQAAFEDAPRGAARHAGSRRGPGAGAGARRHGHLVHWRAGRGDRDHAVHPRRHAGAVAIVPRSRDGWRRRNCNGGLPAPLAGA